MFFFNTLTHNTHLYSNKKNSYLIFAILILIGIVTISRALRKQRRA